MNPKRTEDLLLSERFPRSSAYHPDWVVSSASGGANALWLTEWLAEGLELTAGHARPRPRLRRGRVVDLPAPRIRRAGLGDRLVVQRLGKPPAHSRCRGRGRRVSNPCGCPVAAVRRRSSSTRSCAIDSFVYYGTDDLYLNYLARFVKPGGQVGNRRCRADAGNRRRVPDHLREWWNQDVWCLHSAAWWRRHWERTGHRDIERADTLADGWRLWLDWQYAAAPDNATEITGARGRSRPISRLRPRRGSTQR